MRPKLGYSFFSSLLIIDVSFFCANIGLACFKNERVVIIAYLFSMANSTSMSSLRSIGPRKLWLYAEEAYLGVNFTLNSSFMPMSNRCRLKMSWNSTNNSSIRAISSGARVESFQSKFPRIFLLDSSSFVGLSVSASCKACYSSRIFFWIVVCSSGFRCFLE